MAKAKSVFVKTSIMRKPSTRTITNKRTGMKTTVHVSGSSVHKKDPFSHRKST